MKPKILPLLERCIEDGLMRGYTKAHKHVDEPAPEAIQNAQLNAILHEIYEAFDFEESACTLHTPRLI